jgi:hypothetical protein
MLIAHRHLGIASRAASHSCTALLLPLLWTLFIRRSTQLLSHTTHKPQYSVEQPETTALMKEQTRIRTMGFPRKVEVKGFAHTATKAAAAAAASAGEAVLNQEAAVAASNTTTSSTSSSTSSSKKSGKPAVKASEMIDTLSSKVPLKWAASSVVVPGSSYTAAYGSNPGRSPQVCAAPAALTALASSTVACCV